MLWYITAPVAGGAGDESHTMERQDNNNKYIHTGKCNVVVVIADKKHIMQLKVYMKQYVYDIGHLFFSCFWELQSIQRWYSILYAIL